VRLSVLLLIAPFWIAAAQTAIVTHAATVHKSWTTSSAAVEALAAGDSVTTSSTRAGYTHVTAADGKKGWVYSRYLQAAGSPPSTTTGTTTTTTTPSGTTTGVSPVSDIATLPKPAVVEADDPACPNIGRSLQRLDSATNLLKNRVHDGNFSVVSFQAVLGLPWQNMGTRRYEWTPADLARTADYEGAAISVTGFLVAADPKTGEACNCGNSSPDWVDWHIWLVETKAESAAKNKKNAIVVESTPRVRREFPNRLDLAQVRHWASTQQRVTVSGWLMLDPDHPTDATGTAHKNASRGTIWEIHPVTKIEATP
jgi:hypothetical protein